ncbi:MAG TPA: rhodanese-like domain-containing protein [Edaphocola sp.]|nr:rhodanese-like domain-containing protein [Edaphocola sp.]
MKKIILILFSGLYLVSCQAQNQDEVNHEPQSQTQNKSKYSVLSQSEFEKAISSGDKTIVDVRTPEEYNEGHIKNARNIDYFDSDFQTKMAALDKEKPIYIYCKSGNRSGKAGKILVDLGFKEVYDLKGGAMSWSGALIK